MVRYQSMFVFKFVNGVDEMIQHAISFTLFGTLVIVATPHYDLRQARDRGGPNTISSMGPRL